MKARLVFFFIFITHFSLAQQIDTLTLGVSYEIARNNWPLIKKKAMNKQIAALKLQNIKTNLYPRINLNAQATYQSDVTKIDIEVPMMDIDIPIPSKDQYMVTLEVSQTIFDGGITAIHKELETINRAANNQNVEIQLHHLNERINRTFFLALLLQERKKLIKLTEKVLKSKQKTIQSAVENGAMMQANADVIQAEIMQLQQQYTEIEYGIKAAIEILEEMLLTQISADCFFSMKSLPIAKQNNIVRLEHDLFNFQKDRLNAMRKLSKAKNLPKIAAFGQAGYGRPGLNMMSDEFEPYYIVGAKLTWNLWDWKKASREQSIYDIQSRKVEVQKEVFDKNLQIVLRKEWNTIQKYERLIAQDEEIIKLRKNIEKSASSQLDNGVITSSDYIKELNARLQAEINKQIHRIELEQHKASYMYYLGKQYR